MENGNIEILDRIYFSFLSLSLSVTFDKLEINEGFKYFAIYVTYDRFEWKMDKYRNTFLWIFLGIDFSFSSYLSVN